MGRSPNTPPFAFPAPTRAPARTHRTLFVPPYRARTEGPRPGSQLARLTRRLSLITIVRKFGYPGYLVSRALHRILR